MVLEAASVCVCVCVPVLTLSNMNISEIRRPIAIKFYLKHQWDGGKAESSFGPDWIRTLVFMAIDSSFIFDWIFFHEDNHKISDKFKIRQDPTRDCRVSCP